MIDPARYLSALRLPMPGVDVPAGGQELILGEVIGALTPCLDVWIPFSFQCVTLRATLKQMGGLVFTDEWDCEKVPDADALYFGTPTIVDGKPLFDTGDDLRWTVDLERERVRHLVRRVEQAGYRKIVCGLGSGDVSLLARLHDLDGNYNGSRPTVVATKKFSTGDGEHFDDVVIARDLYTEGWK